MGPYETGGRGIVLFDEVRAAVASQSASLMERLGKMTV